MESVDTLMLQPPISAPPFNKLLASLPADDYQRILPHMKAVPLRFKQVLHKQGERIQDIYFPGGGACSMTKVMENGEAAEIATIGNEGLVGASVFFGDDQSVGETLIQVPDGSGYMMALEPFMAEMERRGAFYNRVIRYYQALMTQVMQTTVCNGLHSAEQRCCRWLLMTHDRVGSDELKLTHEFLSIMLAVRRPTITLIICKLERGGLVANRRGSIRIVDRTALEAASCECYGTVKANFARLLPQIPGPTG